MRLKYVKDGYKIMDEHSKVVTEPELFKGRWNELFNNSNPIHAEFGSGRGGFSLGMARKYKNINFLAFERNTKAIVRGLNKADEIDLDNFSFVHQDVKRILDFFEEESLDRIYLNFSDPWPKAKHESRRLSHTVFLKLYEKVLKKDGEIVMKTDNRDLYLFSLEMFKLNDWTILRNEEDLHSTELKEDNIMTEYEEKFVSLGQNIYYINVKKNRNN